MQLERLLCSLVPPTLNLARLFQPCVIAVGTRAKIFARLWVGNVAHILHFRARNPLQLLCLRLFFRGSMGRDSLTATHHSMQTWMHCAAGQNACATPALHALHCSGLNNRMPLAYVQHEHKRCGCLHRGMHKMSVHSRGGHAERTAFTACFPIVGVFVT